MRDGHITTNQQQNDLTSMTEFFQSCRKAILSLLLFECAGDPGWRRPRELSQLAESRSSGRSLVCRPLWEGRQAQRSAIIVEYRLVEKRSRKCIIQENCKKFVAGIYWDNLIIQGKKNKVRSERRGQQSQRGREAPLPFWSASNWGATAGVFDLNISRRNLSMPTATDGRNANKRVEMWPQESKCESKCKNVSQNTKTWVNTWKRAKCEMQVET